ncbi:Uncharacterised protein [Salmonella enterica subsp. enterica]|uniref:Uncharacterized protein n=1 Tax=Salmonella enterica I TaxID=59201 RepID=A0A379WHA9_SALET|nr:Uncharacterised protein [Salmonella enterica subsp. enterica]
MSDSKRCCEVIIRSSAVTILVKTGASGEELLRTRLQLRMLTQVALRHFISRVFNLRAGFARLHASHSKSGELTSIVTMSNRSGGQTAD